jgi:hypothetical protein
MEQTALTLNPLLSVIKEEDYLVVEHEDYGHVTELHPDDYLNHKELLREALTFAANQELPPWD